jgi:hypothetical protein
MGETQQLLADLIQVALVGGRGELLAKLAHAVFQVPVVVGEFGNLGGNAAIRR